MNTWNAGIKEVCKEIAERQARQKELQWLNDPSNENKFKEAVKAHEKVERYR